MIMKWIRFLAPTLYLFENVSQIVVNLLLHWNNVVPEISDHKCFVLNRCVQIKFRAHNIVRNYFYWEINVSLYINRN